MATGFGIAQFDDFKVFGQNGFLTEEGSYEVLFEDPFYRLDLDGDPYMWGLMGEDPANPGGSAWKVVDGGAGYGKVLQGTASGDPNLPTLAIRGDRGWINKAGEFDDMDYWVQTDVKLASTAARAALCLRVAHNDNLGPGYRCYRLLIDGAAQKLKFQRRQWYVPPSSPGLWLWIDITSQDISDPTELHTINVEARGYTFECYLDGNLCFQQAVVDMSYEDGLVGLWVNDGSAWFDNVKVLDLR